MGLHLARARPGRRCRGLWRRPVLCLHRRHDPGAAVRVSCSRRSRSSTPPSSPRCPSLRPHGWSCWRSRSGRAGRWQPGPHWRLASGSLQGIQGVAGLYGEQLVLGPAWRPQRAQVVRGVGPLRRRPAPGAAYGRVFTDQEQQDGAAVVMLTDRGWQRLYARSTTSWADRSRCAGARTRSSACCRSALDYPPGADFVAPAGPDYQRAPRGGNWLQVVGRLAPGVTLSARRPGSAGRGATVRRGPTPSDRPRASTCA